MRAFWFWHIGMAKKARLSAPTICGSSRGGGAEHRMAGPSAYGWKQVFIIMSRSLLAVPQEMMYKHFGLVEVVMRRISQCASAAQAEFQQHQNTTYTKALRQMRII